jgi:hypothetical protein
MRFASGDIEMASHGEALVNLGSGQAGASVFAILDLCGLSPRDMNLLVFEPVQPHIRSPLGRLHHDPACGGHELRKMKPF